MTDVALVPKRHVLQRYDCVAADDARQTAQTFACDRIALVRHSRTAFLAFAKKFFHFENLSTLEMTKFGRPSIDARGDHRKRSDKLRVAIALHNLRREHCRF